MHSFKDFQIQAVSPGLQGDKIKIERVLNKEIVIEKYRIGASRYPEKGNGQRLDMQIKIGDETRVVWTSSVVLQQMITQVPQQSFPFITTIVKQNECFQFT